MTPEPSAPLISSSTDAMALLDRLGESIPARVQQILRDFHSNHGQVARSLGAPESEIARVWSELVDHVARACTDPYPFPAYSPRVTQPTDMQKFGWDFWRPVVDWRTSAIIGVEHLDELADARRRGDNVVLFGNHQTEPDPHLLSLLIADRHRDLAEQIVFLAGDRVLTDPVAIPYSMGCNLLSVYSRRRMDQPPELRDTKLAHNRRAMATLADMLRAGGLCVFVAPSGGRDRPTPLGDLEVAPFDSQAIEMISLVVRQARTTTRLHPIALSTHDVLPPPPTIEIEIGERRVCGGGPVRAAFGEHIDLDAVARDTRDRDERRTARAAHVEAIVRNLYRTTREQD